MPVRFLIFATQTQESLIDWQIIYLATLFTILIQLLVTVWIIRRNHFLRLRVRKAESDLSAVDQEKKEFLANISHELLTPMNAVSGMTDYLLSTSSNLENRKLLEFIATGAKKELELIESIIEYNSAISGNLSVNNEFFDIAKVANKVVSELHLAAREKGLELHLNINLKNRNRAYGDPYFLERVLLILGGNAVKFTSEGYVAININASSFHWKRQRIIINVSDSGPGLSDKHQKDFERPLRQADSSLRRPHSGLGTGLTIAQIYLGLMGSKLEYINKKSKGACFQFLLTSKAEAAYAQS